MTDAIQYYKIMFIIPLVILITLEIIWSWKNDKKVYDLKETVANMGVLLGFQLSKFIFAGYQLTVMSVAQNWALFTLPDNWFTCSVAFFLTDFIYYWFHRLSHKWKVLWAFHSVHHTSQYMNLTASYRLNWFSALITPVFFLPPVVLGFSPELIIICYTVNLVYQFFMHTESVGKLGRLEGILDTPSAHRVHHGCNDLYIDKNFGGVFMIWDRLFKTYQPETKKSVYGQVDGFVSYNPFVLVLHEFTQLFKKKQRNQNRAKQLR